MAAGRIPQVAGEFFLVDPLDGTKEFIAKRGDFTVNIALVRDGLPVLGVVFAPANAKLFAGDVAARPGVPRRAEAGSAAQRRARADSRARAARSRADRRGVALAQQRRRPTPISPRNNVVDLVSVGSSLKFCLVAAGEADVYPRLGPTMEWDTAAGHAVLAAAGGKVLTLDGAPLRYGKPEFRNPRSSQAASVAPLSAYRMSTTTTQHALSLHLKRLEAESIAIIREVAAEFRNPGDAVFDRQGLGRDAAPGA